MFLTLIAIFGKLSGRGTSWRGNTLKSLLAVLLWLFLLLGFFLQEPVNGVLADNQETGCSMQITLFRAAAKSTMNNRDGDSTDSKNTVANDQ